MMIKKNHSEREKSEREDRRTERRGRQTNRGVKTEVHRDRETGRLDRRKR